MEFRRNFHTPATACEENGTISVSEKLHAGNVYLEFVAAAPMCVWPVLRPTMIIHQVESTLIPTANPNQSVSDL